MMNFNTIKGSDTKVKAEVRTIAFELLMNAFVEAVGANNVSIVGNNELAVCVGTRTLADGTEGEVCFTVKPVAKDFDLRTAEKSGKVFQPFERLTAADLYEVEKTEKEKKAEAKAKAKAAKIQRDKEARAERARKKAEEAEAAARE